ncbi:MAG: peptidoglycan-binding protein [Bacillota bacterium]
MPKGLLVFLLFTLVLSSCGELKPEDALSVTHPEPEVGASDTNTSYIPHFQGCEEFFPISTESPDPEWAFLITSALGYYGLECSVSSAFTHQTAAAVSRFQKDQGLPSTGIVDLNTLQALLPWMIDATSESPVLAGTAPKNAYVLIDTYTRTLYVFSGREEIARFPVALGKPSTPTPIGDWKIKRKLSGWGGGFGTHWMQLDVPWGVYGIHGTNKPYSIGREASGGCIRMHNAHVARLYALVEVGTPVKIIGDLRPKRALQDGDRGSDVLLVQKRLAELGYYTGELDGFFGPILKGAVIAFQRDNGLTVDGLVGWSTFERLEIDEE